MDENKIKQRKMRRYVYLLAGAYIVYQAVSMVLDVKRGVAMDNPALILGAAAVMAAAGLALIAFQVCALRREQKEEAEREDGEQDHENEIIG